MKSYSIDLRKKVMDKVQAQNTPLNEIAEIFNIDAKTIYRWRKKLEKTGSFQATTNYQKGHSHKIIDLKKIEEFVQSNPNLNLKELAQKWGNVGPSTINRALHKINFSFKKNNLRTKKKMKKKENCF